MTIMPTGIEFLDKESQEALDDLVRAAETEGLFVTGVYSGRIAAAYGENIHVLAVNEYGHIFSQQIPRGKVPKGSARDGNAILYIGVRKQGKSKTKYIFAGH